MSNPIARLVSWIAGAQASPDPIEPTWEEVLASVDERRAASHYWRSVTSAMRRAGTLRAVHAHALMRLTTCYLIFDRSSARVLRESAVASFGGQSADCTIQREASELATLIEAELGLSPPRAQTGRR